MPTLIRDSRGTPLPIFVYGATQSMDIDTSSLQSGSFDPDTNILRLVSTVDCNYKSSNAGEDSANADTCPMLPAKTVEYIGINPGDTIYVISNDGSSTGTLYITEIA